MAGDTVSVGWTVTNDGGSTTDNTSWVDNVYLETEQGYELYLGQIVHDGALAAGGSYTTEGTFSLPTDLATSDYYFVVATDAENQVLQASTSGNKNNSAADAVTQLPPSVIAPTEPTPAPVIPGASIVVPPSDLSISNVTNPSEVLSGQELTVSWTLTDTGNATSSDWTDEVYLSSNQVLDTTTDIALGSFTHNTSLAGGASQTFTSSFKVPDGLSGPYYVFVVADAGNSLNDPNRSNNIAGDAAVEVDLPPPINLSVGNVSITQASGTDTIVNGGTVAMSDNVIVTYTVSNLSESASSGSWDDAIYLSTDGIWNISDPLLGYVQEDGIAANGSFTGTLTAALPGLVDGNYYAIVKTNVLDNQPNSNQANNTAASTDTIAANLPALTLGTPATGSLTAGGFAYYQFTVAAGQTVDLAMTSDTAGTANDIYVSYQTIPTIGQFDATSTEPFAQNPNAVIQESQPGTYYIMVRESAGGPENYSLTATTVNYSITGLSLTKGSNLGNVTVTINGAEFNAGEQVELIASNGAVRAASEVYYVNSGELWATFDLQGLSVGSYSVKVQDATQSATLANGFTVTNGPAGQLSVSLAAPSALHTHSSPDGLTGTQNGIVTIDYINSGDTDIPAPIFDLQAVNAEFQADAPGLVGPSEITVVGTSQTGPAGILTPGAEEQVSYTFAGNFGYAQFTTMQLILGTLQGSNAIVDWGSLEQSVQPVSIDSTDWNLIWTRFENLVGGTTQSLLNALSQAATTLSQIGESTNDLGTLLSYVLEQASGTLPNITLASTTDLADTGSGIDLSLTRTYSASLLNRNEAGAFGDGWTFTYGITATTDGLGNVYINSPSGTEFFTLNSNGTYSAQAGDSSKLTVIEGSYVLTDASGTVETFNANGTISRITDSNGNTVSVSYGSNGYISGVTGSNGQSLAFTTNATGQITSATDGNGQTVTYTYDESGEHLLSASSAEGVTSYSYDSSGNPLSQNALTQITNPDGTQQNFTYDDQGNLVSQSGTGGAGEVTYGYSSPGVVTETDANGNTSTLIYDAKGNLAEVQDAAGNVTQLSYDANGDLTGIIAPGGAAYRFTYDSNGNLTSYTDPLGGTVKATYEPGTNLLASFTDQDGNTTDYSYNAAGNLTGIIYDDGSGSSYAYAPDGALTSSTDAMGNTTQYTYNAAGELAKESFADATSQSYSYDSSGNLLTATATDGGVTSYTYNAAKELTSVTNPQGQMESYGYNSAGQEIQRVEPDGSITNYTYTAAGQIAELTDGNGNLLVNYTYNAAGQLTGANMGNGASTAYTYDAVGNVTGITTYAADNSVTSQLTYTYDAEGQPVTATSLDGSWTYSYDSDGQVTNAVFVSTNASIADQNLTYVYDAAGNRTQTIFNGAVTNYTTNGLNQYTSANGTIYDYDANGNLISTTSGGQTTTYTYNDQNELVSETGPSGTTTYQYDALGNQVSSTVSGVTLNYVIDPLAISTSATGPLASIAQVYNASGNVTATYDYGDGLAAVANSLGTYYYNTDVTGNVTGLSGQNGNLVDTYDYTPFGTLIKTTGNLYNPYQFSGILGAVTYSSGVVDMEARQYDSTLGRFIEPDPSGISGGLNLYAYVGNAPTKFLDPTGRDYFLFIPGNPGIPPAPNERPFYPNQVDPNTIKFWNNYFQNIDNQINASGQVLLGVSQTLYGAAPFVFNILRRRIPNPKSIGELAEHSHSVIEGINNIREGIEKFENASQSTVQAVKSVDPNDIIGPSGYGAKNFIGAAASDAYTINFENAATATAPAQTIVITQQLSSNLDWRTFRFTGFGLGTVTTELSGNQAFYSGLLNEVSTLGCDVQVTAGVNVETGLVTWTFQAIDPTTGQAPVNPEIGLLPPDDAEGDGEGFVSYTVQANSNVQTGDTIAAQATVVFDTNAPINTPTITNTIDAVAPTSAVQALPSQEQNTSFDVSWSGADDPTGSGIASYTIMVSEDGGTPTVWLDNTTRTNAIFTGEVGHTYAFSSEAIDNAGNQEAEHTTPDTETTIACFCAGTRITTAKGKIPVEKLKIGDLLPTLHAGKQKIKWIGTRSYGVPFTANNHLVLPICIKRHAIAKNIPSRDLFVSPGHAICIEGVLVHAWRLVNGVSITQSNSVAGVTYYHIELDNHEIIFAENCPTETFMGESFRNMFHNAAEYRALYPDPMPEQTMCLPRLDSGFVLAAIHRRLAARAGIKEPSGFGLVRGYIDQVRDGTVSGWAQYSGSPETPVCLDILADGLRIGRALANLYREDVRNAGYGSGHHGFEFTLPRHVTGLIDVRCSKGHVALDRAIHALAA